MAEVIQIDSNSMPWFYNVTQSVGRGGANRKDDTLLVQYLLKKAFEVPLYAPARPSRDMLLDGICGPLTTSYLIAFQKRGNQMNPETPTWLDCLVDHAMGSGISGKYSGLIYTITALNKTFHDNFPDLFVDPGSATDMPPHVKAIMVPIADSQQLQLA